MSFRRIDGGVEACGVSGVSHTLQAGGRTRRVHYICTRILGSLFETGWLVAVCTEIDDENP